MFFQPKFCVDRSLPDTLKGIKMKTKWNLPSRILKYRKRRKVQVLFSHVRLFVTPWNSPGKNTGAGSHSLLQGIFPIQGSNPGPPALQEDSLPSEPPGKPRKKRKLEATVKNQH